MHRCMGRLRPYPCGLRHQFPERRTVLGGSFLFWACRFNQFGTKLPAVGFNLQSPVA
jgi:hypothetical protein